MGQNSLKVFVRMSLIVLKMLTISPYFWTTESPYFGFHRVGNPGLLLSLTVKEFWKPVNICRSYGQLSTGLFFYEIWCITPRHLASSTIEIDDLLRNKHGSGCCFRSLQKWMQTVLVEENLKPFVSAQPCNLFRHCCRCRSMMCNVCLLSESKLKIE